MIIAPANYTLEDINKKNKEQTASAAADKSYVYQMIDPKNRLYYYVYPEEGVTRWLPPQNRDVKLIDGQPTIMDYAAINKAMEKNMAHQF